MTEICDWSERLDSSTTKDESLVFESPILMEAYMAWSRLGDIPSRSQFTPRSSKAFLGNLMIFEQRDSTFRIRLMGTRVSCVLGEMQGKLLPEAVPPDVAVRWQAHLSEVIANRKPTRAVKTVAFNDLHYLEAELFLAPLLDGAGELTMVFAVVAFRMGVAPSHQLGDLIAASR